MTAKELAALLNGRERGHEISNVENIAAMEAGLVVVFGASDDLMELRGAIEDEVGCYNGGTALLDDNGIVAEPDCGDGYCQHYRDALVGARRVDAMWGAEGYSWTYKTDIPHETFDIAEGGEKYCRGIVFEMRRLSGNAPYDASRISRAIATAEHARTKYLSAAEDEHNNIRRKMLQDIADDYECALYALEKLLWEG